MRRRSCRSCDEGLGKGNSGYTNQEVKKYGKLYDLRSVEFNKLGKGCLGEDIT